MGFANNTCSFTRFRIVDPVPAELWTSIEDKLKQFAFMDIDELPEMQSKGWVCFEDMLDTRWRTAPPQKGAYIVFSLRLDTRRIPAAVVKKHLTIALKEEKARISEQGKTFIARERKKEIKEQVMLRLRARFLPIPAEFNVLWATDRNEIWFASTQNSMIDLFMELFLQTFELRLEQITPYTLALTLLDVLDYYCIPIWDNYPEGAVEKRREEGKITTWYTCCTDSWPNTFTFSYPAEAEWIGWYVAANGLDGYLRWAFNSWPEDPMRDSRFTAWAAGDTYLVYPGGLSSIRFERLKAGITAYRKIMALREEFTRTGNRSGLARLEKALALFRLPDADAVRQHVLDKDMPDFAADAVNAAKKMLERY